MDYSQFMGKMSCEDYLKYALFSIMEEKSIHKINVKELCDRAMINRSTFYSHYTSIEEFYKSVLNDVCVGLVKAVESESSVQDILWDREAAIRRYTKWYDHIRRNAREFSLLLGENGTSIFHKMLLKQGIDWYSQLLEPIKLKPDSSISKEVLVNYIVNAHLGMLYYYLANGKKFSPEYMASQMVNITMAGPYSLLML